MPKPLTAVLSQIAEKQPPKVILVGGSSEFLAQKAFHDLRDAIIASYRTMSLFASARLLIVPEVNAFVSAKELLSLFQKAATDWKSAKTDRKRASSAAKLLHVLGLAGADLDMTDRQIA